MAAWEVKPVATDMVQLFCDASEITLIHLPRLSSRQWASAASVGPGPSTDIPGNELKTVIPHTSWRSERSSLGYGMAPQAKGDGNPGSWESL